MTQKTANKSRSARMLSALVLSLLSACAAYPTDPADLATMYVNSARNAAHKANGNSAVEELLAAFRYPTSKEKVQALLQNDKTTRELVEKELRKRILAATDVHRAIEISQDLSAFSQTNSLPAEELHAALEENIARNVRDGRLSITPAQAQQHFPKLSSPSFTAAVSRNSISHLKRGDSTHRREHLIGLMEYALQQGPNSEAMRTLKEQLPELRIRRSELSVVEQLFPDYARTREDELTVDALLLVKGGDRLTQIDLKEIIAINIPALRLQTNPSQADLRIEIEQVRNDERTAPETTTTVTYAQHEVDTMKAVMLMPRNSSYMFDLVTGSQEIDYGYIITVSDATGSSERIVRGRVGGSYSRCENKRIRNVFGGVSPASFTANDDMQKKCSGGSPVAMDELRKAVHKEVIGAILQIPSIRSKVELST